MEMLLHQEQRQQPQQYLPLQQGPEERYSKGRHQRHQGQRCLQLLLLQQLLVMQLELEQQHGDDGDDDELEHAQPKPGCEVHHHEDGTSDRGVDSNALGRYILSVIRLHFQGISLYLRIRTSIGSRSKSTARQSICLVEQCPQRKKREVWCMGKHPITD